ncbi:MAG: dockerin type I repeat-containing protein [Lachnospira sp.]|nr:dockerin type I repeat-containing protein [Lachnospira sp.]
MGKTLKKGLSILLAIVLVIGMMPANMLSVRADIGKIDVTEIISNFRSANEIPVAGKPVVAMSYGYLQVAANAVYNAPSEKGVWHDSQGNEINASYDSTGYCFEAGKEYYFEAVYTIKNGSYIFAGANTTVTLSDVDSSLYRADIITEESDDYSLTVRYTFTVPGEADKTIDCIVLNGTGDISEGSSYSVDIGYHNCAISEQRWFGEFDNSGKFIADNSYTLNVTFTAKEGYTFASDIDVDLITEITKAKFEPVQFFVKEDGTVLDVTYVFDVSSKIQWDEIDVNIPLYYMDLAPVCGKVSGTMPGAWFAVDDNAVYEIVPAYGDTYYWYDEDGKNYEMKEYQIGKKYYFDMAFRIKEEYMSEYEFGSNVTGNLYGESLNMDQFVKSEFRYNGSRYEVIVTFYFEAGFGKSVGYSSSNPAICYSYADLEYALEHKKIRYVAVGNVEDMLPAQPLVMTDNVDPRRYAIQITGRKDLTLLGDATFTCPISMEYDIYTYVELISVLTGGELNIYGPGSLRFKAGNLYFYKSVIKVDGGDLHIDGATIIGDVNADDYSYGINAIRGSVSIDGGAIIKGRDNGAGGIAALSLGDEGLNDSLSVSIWNGNFYVERHNNTPENKYNYGLTLNNDVGLRIYSATFDGVQLGRYAADNLGEYIADGSVVCVDEQKIEPDNYATINGKIVEVYKEIASVDVNINSPVGGEAPAWYTEEVYGVEEGCKVESVTWYENGEVFEPVYGSERFTAGNTYRVEIALSADDGVRFANPLTSATINYKNNVTIDAYKGDLEKGIVLGYDFGVCPNSISNVELTVTEPKENERPSYTVSCGSNGYYAVGGSSNYTDYRQWYVSDTGEDNSWTEMNPTDTFVAGKYYRFYVDIIAASGYEFSLKDVGTIQPDVSATVNGCYATVFKAYDQDPSGYITVQYDFGVCNDTVIERVDIIDIDKPFPGNEPDYTAVAQGTGYYIDNTSAYDIWGYNNGVEIRYYYKLNGISWYDVDEKKYLYTHETFKAGHNYTVYVDLKIDSDSGYEFDIDDGGESKVNGCVNGDYLNPVQVVSKVSNSQWNQYLECTFSWEVMDVSEVEVSGITSPTAGNTPDYEGVVGDSAVYDFAPYGLNGTSGFWWYDSEGNVLTEDDAFVLGESYTLEIKLIPKMDGQVVLTRFKTPVTATLNGMTVDSADVMASSSVVYIYETYVCEEAPTGAFLYGTVISATGDYGDTILELYEASEYGMNNAVPYAKRTIQGDNAEYAIVNVPTGEYIIKVSREGHATYEYTLTVNNQTIVHNVTLWLFGDGNHDGLVDVKDAVLLKKHLASMTVEMDEDVMDVNVDLTIDIKDAVKLMKKLAGMTVELGKA